MLVLWLFCVFSVPLLLFVLLYKGGLAKITVEAGWATSVGATFVGATFVGATSVGAKPKPQSI